MFVTPPPTPVTTPVDEPTVAIEVLPDVHEPPDGLPVRLIVEPTHTMLGPEILAPEVTVKERVTYVVPTA